MGLACFPKKCFYTFWSKEMMSPETGWVLISNEVFLFTNGKMGVMLTVSLWLWCWDIGVRWGVYGEAVGYWVGLGRKGGCWCAGYSVGGGIVWGGCQRLLLIRGRMWPIANCHWYNVQITFRNIRFHTIVTDANNRYFSIWSWKKKTM